MDENNEVVEEIEQEQIVEEVEPEVEAPKKRGRKTKVAVEVPTKQTTFQPGDHVMITAKVGAFLDGTPMTGSMRREYYIVISENNNIVTLYDQSRIFKRRLPVSYLKRVGSK